MERAIFAPGRVFPEKNKMKISLLEKLAAMTKMYRKYTKHARLLALDLTPLLQ